jgi:hypothetical protein
MITNTLKLNNQELNRNLFWIFSVSIFVMSIFYIFFVISTIKNVVAIEDMEISKNELALSIGGSEFKLISMKNNITIDLAKNIGFEEIKEQSYITKKSVSFLVKNR